MTDSNLIWKYFCLKEFKIKEEEEEKIQNWKLLYINLMKPKIEITFASSISNKISISIGNLMKLEELILILRESFEDDLLSNPTHIIVKRNQDDLKKPFKSIENILLNPALFSNTIQFLGINEEEFRFCESCGSNYSTKSLLPKTCISHNSSKQWYQFTHPSLKLTGKKSEKNNQNQMKGKQKKK